MRVSPPRRTRGRESCLCRSRPGFEDVDENLLGDADFADLFELLLPLFLLFPEFPFAGESD